MLYIRCEGDVVRDGFNFYPWHDRKYNLGFVFGWNQFRFMLRRRSWGVVPRWIYLWFRSDPRFNANPLI